MKSQEGQILAGKSNVQKVGLARFARPLVTQNEAGMAYYGEIAFCMVSGTPAGSACFQADKLVQSKLEELLAVGSSFALRTAPERVLAGRKTGEQVTALGTVCSVAQVALGNLADSGKADRLVLTALRLAVDHTA
jgi:hypothetical protein